jgi:membrane protease YdiL (CAAX protease family)
MTKKHMTKKQSNRVVTPDWIVGPRMQQKQGLLWYTIIIIIAATGFHLVEWISRQGDVGDVNSLWFSGVNNYYFWHGIAFGLYIPFMLLRIVPKIEIVQIQEFGATNIIKQFVLCFGLSIAAEVVFGIILRPVLGIISGAELVFFFVFGAVVEEVVYRFLIQNVIMGLLKIILGAVKLPKSLRKNNYWLPGIISTIIASFIFMLAHLGVYGATPSSLFGTFGLGIAFGTGYLISNNLLVPIMTHALVNGFTKAFQVGAGLSSTLGDLTTPIITILIMLIITVFVRLRDGHGQIKPIIKAVPIASEKQPESKKASRVWPWFLALFVMVVISFLTSPGWFSVPYSLEIPPSNPLLWIFIMLGIFIIPVVVFELVNLIKTYHRGKQ